MIERLKEQLQAEQEKVPGKFGPEKAAKRFLKELMVKSAMLSEKRFPSYEEMSGVGEQFARDIGVLLEEAGDISRVKLRAVGSNLVASNVDIRHDETGLSLSVDTSEPFLEQGLLAECEGYFAEVRTEADGDPKGYFFTPQLVLQHTLLIPVMTSEDVPVANVALQELIKVPLTGDTHITIPVLEARAAQKKALAEVAFNNFQNGREIMAALHEVKKAFKHTVGTMYMELEDISQLQRLGRVESAEAETVAAAVRELFGHERQVLVEAEAYRGVEAEALENLILTGKVVDIINGHDKLPINGPAMVIDTSETKLYYVPLSLVESLQF